MDTYCCRDVRFISAEPRVVSRPQNNTNFVPHRCSKCRDVGIVTELFMSHGQMTVHTKAKHGCYYNPYGNRFVPINPDQLAEGRARTIARQVEREHRQRRREQPGFRNLSTATLCHREVAAAVSSTCKRCSLRRRQFPVQVHLVLLPLHRLSVVPMFYWEGNRDTSSPTRVDPATVIRCPPPRRCHRSVLKQQFFRR